MVSLVCDVGLSISGRFAFLDNLLVLWSKIVLSVDKNKRNL